MFHPRYDFCLDSCPFPASFLKESGLSVFRGYDGYSGRNSVWMTNKAAVFARSTHCLSLTVFVMMLLMKPYIDASDDVISTAKGVPINNIVSAKPSITLWSDACKYGIGGYIKNGLLWQWRTPAVWHVSEGIPV